MNRIVAENTLTGAPATEWDVTPAEDDGSIEGFATEMSVNLGETVFFKVRTAATAYRLDIYRLGFYAGHGARHVATVRPPAVPQAPPPGLLDPATRLLDCGNWEVSAVWTVPATATSGIYVAKLVREDGGAGAGHIVFVVRDDASDADLLFQTSDTTWQAYNHYDGKSLYEFLQPPDPRAYKVSYNRPCRSRYAEYGANYLFGGEYPMVRWLEANGYDVTYCAAVDVHRSADRLLRHKVFLSVGHDEYWSGEQRAHVTAARDRGVHLAFFSGNSVYWKVRWEADAQGHPGRTLVCYKDGAAKLDPTPEWTGLWRDGRFQSPPAGARPENGLTGVLTGVAGFTSNAIVVPYEYRRLRFWRDTDVVALKAEEHETLTAGTLGHEWDRDIDNGCRPAGLVRLSEVTFTFADDVVLLNDDGKFGPGTATHHATLYRHAGGALVFSAGTVQWSWGLDGHHDTPPTVTPGPPDRCVRQATVNLLADMGTFAETLQADLVAATPSTDTTPPTSSIAIPADGQTLTAGAPLPALGALICGTAHDVDGVVAAVEVSVDGGVSWHPASGTTNWSFPWLPAGNGLVTILSRAVDDSGNIQDRPARARVIVGEAVDAGPGGPILVVVNGSHAANPFGGYYAEILQAEGLACFETIELALLMEQPDPMAFLSSFGLVLLAESALLPAQERLMRGFVAAGGALIAMRPSPGLADLFGLAFAGRRAEVRGTPQFLRFDGTAGPGAGLTTLSLQYHGDADRYLPVAATTLASLCDGIDAASTHPAVARHGRAVAFAFDVARSVLLTRQGNPDWKDSEGDGVGPGWDPPMLAGSNYPAAAFRAMDMFSRTDGAIWFEPARLHVPQADELQRFLANTILDLIERPLPRLWYLPNAHKWLIVNTGDTCSSSPDQQKNTVAAANRFGTMSIYAFEAHLGVAAGITRDTHDEWEARGNDVGVHASDSSGTQSIASLTDVYGRITQVIFAAFRHVSRSCRNHTGEWVGWTDMARIEADCGTRLDLNYYHYLSFTAAERGFTKLRLPMKPEGSTGYFTGSGLAQRFCDEHGRTLPIYQLLTEWADEFFHDNSVEKGVAGGFTRDAVIAAIRRMIDAAEQGFYSAFVMQTHPTRFSWWTGSAADPPGTRPADTDFVSEWAPEIWKYAHARGVPMVSAGRFLDFVETRAATSFANLTWNGSELAFDLEAPAAGQALTVLLPAAQLLSIEVDGAAIALSVQPLMGRDYATVTTTRARTRVVAAYGP